MKKTLFQTLCVILALGPVIGCTKAEAPVVPEESPLVSGTITARVGAVDTKVDFSQEDQALVLRWSSSDALRVIRNPETGSETNALYTLTEMNEGGRTAVFSGSIASSGYYNIQYPGILATTARADERSYSGQKQRGNGNTDHLKTMWAARLATYYTSTPPTSVDFTGEELPAGVKLLRSGVVKFHLQLPAEMRYPASVTLSSSQPDFCLNYKKRKSNRLTLFLEDIDLDADAHILTAYMVTPWKEAVVPVGRTLQVLVTDRDGNTLSRNITLTEPLRITPGGVQVVKLNKNGWTTPSAAGSELYVATTGDDTAAGSIDAPLRTLTKALALAQPGTRIILRGGTYSASFTGDPAGMSVYAAYFLPVSGLPGHPITIAAYPGETPVLDGGRGKVLLDVISADEANRQRHMDYYRAHTRTGAEADLYNEMHEGGILAISGSHVVLEGLTLTGSVSAGIYGYNGASDIEVRSCTVKHCGAPGICFGDDDSPSADIRVIGNTVEDCAQMSREAISLRTVDKFEIAGNIVREVIKESIDAKSGCSNGVIRDNRVYDSGHAGIYLDAGFPDSGKAQENIQVYGNIIDNPLGVGICVASESGNDMRDIQIYNNLTFSYRVMDDTDPLRNSGSGIKVANNGTSTQGLLENIYIYHNTVYNFAQQGLYVNYPTVNNIVFAHNIVTGPRDLMAIKSGVETDKIRFDRNCAYGTTCSVEGSGRINQDPLFTNAAGRDFTLLPGSPLLNLIPASETAIRGIGTASVPFPSNDLQGTARPQETGYEPGAYEYVAGAPLYSLEDLEPGSGNW
ncbi:MAG: right-handed parallel beta-helix repeat-containing protein [Bacteroidales bacterium]|nr:right-handed parallel beta-helix repeat-containing protein [Bacteroidales bacterium]